MFFTSRTHFYCCLQTPTHSLKKQLWRLRVEGFRGCIMGIPGFMSGAGQVNLSIRGFMIDVWALRSCCLMLSDASDALMLSVHSSYSSTLL